MNELERAKKEVDRLSSEIGPEADPVELALAKEELNRLSIEMDPGVGLAQAEHELAEKADVIRTKAFEADPGYVKTGRIMLHRDMAGRLIGAIGAGFRSTLERDASGRVIAITEERIA